MLTCTLIPPTAITERVACRALKPYGVALLKGKIQRLGFLPQYPLLVIPLGDDTYRCIDGSHRLEAARALGLTEVPVMIREPRA